VCKAREQVVSGKPQSFWGLRGVLDKFLNLYWSSALMDGTCFWAPIPVPRYRYSMSTSIPPIICPFDFRYGFRSHTHFFRCASTTMAIVANFKTFTFRPTMAIALSSYWSSRTIPLLVRLSKAMSSANAR
jgi:hypothetical protein